MNKLFVISRYNKKLLVLILAFIVDLLCIFGLVVFDIVELVVASQNAANLSDSFIAINIVLAGLSILSIALVLWLIVLKRRKTKNGL